MRANSSILLITLAASAHADPAPLDVEGAIAFAAAHHPSLRADAADVRAATEQIDVERAKYTPDLETALHRDVPDRHVVQQGLELRLERIEPNREVHVVVHGEPLGRAALGSLVVGRSPVPSAALDQAHVERGHSFLPLPFDQNGVRILMKATPGLKIQDVASRSVTPAASPSSASG